MPRSNSDAQKSRNELGANFRQSVFLTLESLYDDSLVGNKIKITKEFPIVCDPIVGTTRKVDIAVTDLVGTQLLVAVGCKTSYKDRLSLDLWIAYWAKKQYGCLFCEVTETAMGAKKKVRGVERWRTSEEITADCQRAQAEWTPLDLVVSTMGNGRGILVEHVRTYLKHTLIEKVA